MISDDFEGEVYDTSLDDYKTYEEYLTSHVTKEDLYYLEDMELARQLKELGYHAKTEIMSREQFEAKKKAIEEARSNRNKDKAKRLAHIDVEDPEKIERCPFLKALAEREEQVLNGRLLSIIFIRHESKKTEVSGYIDFSHRLKNEDFKTYFSGRKKLLPKPMDLSYYNWKTNRCYTNDSPNFKVDSSNGEKGLWFRNKRDRKVINVDPSQKPDENVKRVEIESPDYKQIVIYDYYTRRKY